MLELNDESTTIIDVEMSDAIKAQRKQNVPKDRMGTLRRSKDMLKSVIWADRAVEKEKQRIQQMKELKVGYDDNQVDNLMLDLRDTRSQKSNLQLYLQAEKCFAETGTEIVNLKDQNLRINGELNELSTKFSSLEAKVETDLQSISTDLKELKEQISLILHGTNRTLEKLGRF